MTRDELLRAAADYRSARDRLAQGANTLLAPGTPVRVERAGAWVDAEAAGPVSGDRLQVWVTLPGGTALAVPVERLLAWNPELGAAPAGVS